MDAVGKQEVAYTHPHIIFTNTANTDYISPHTWKIQALDCELGCNEGEMWHMHKVVLFSARKVCTRDVR